MRQVDLRFADFLEKFEKLGKEEWVTVYSLQRDDAEWAGFYCALVASEVLESCLSGTSWDLSIGNGLPGWSLHYEKGQEVISYYRHSTKGIEPLIVFRSFHGMRDNYWEINEEFRYYFNLYEDKARGRFILIDDNGDEEEVANISPQEIRIKLRLIKEFLAAKNMHLGLFFSIDRFSEKKVEELGITEYRDEKRGEHYVYSIGARNFEFGTDNETKSQGYIIGKKFIDGLKDFKPKLFGREDGRYADFIIGVDEEGKDITHTCDEEKLSNYFGKNPGAPHFLTPVFFRREVLAKYYSQPEKYSVEDGYLRCGGLWGLRMDNNHPDHVMVFLGDLGRLAYNEQLHWKSFNLRTRGKISRTAWRRGFEGEFADPEAIDLVFKQRFAAFQEEWGKAFGWTLFKPLTEADQHHFKALRVPLTNEQKEFDEQVLSLVKIFIDSLDEEELSKGIRIEKEGARGLDKLEAFFAAKGLQFPKMMEFLRNLQTLRSTSVAHRKGRNYEKMKDYFHIGEKDLSKVFSDIIVSCIWTLNTLSKHFLEEK